jgi:hypothetical protein
MYLIIIDYVSRYWYAINFLSIKEIGVEASARQQPLARFRRFP